MAFFFFKSFFNLYLLYFCIILGTLELGLGELFEASIDGKGKWYPLQGNFKFILYLIL